MKSLSFPIFLILILCSCNKKKQDLKIELLNNEIVCVDNVESYNFHETRYQPNKEYDSISKNILHYRITNTSDKKYFIMFNQNAIGTLERDLYREALGRKDFSPLNSLDFSLYKNKVALDARSTRAEIFCGTMTGFEIQQREALIDSFLKKNKLDRIYAFKEIDFRDESLHDFVLHPGETKYFTSIINLPYRDDMRWFSNIDKLKPDRADIHNDSADLQSVPSKIGNTK